MLIHALICCDKYTFSRCEILRFFSSRFSPRLIADAAVAFGGKGGMVLHLATASLAIRDWTLAGATAVLVSRRNPTAGSHICRVGVWKLNTCDPRHVLNSKPYTKVALGRVSRDGGSEAEQAINKVRPNHDTVPKEPRLSMARPSPPKRLPSETISPDPHSAPRLNPSTPSHERFASPRSNLPINETKRKTSSRLTHTSRDQSSNPPPSS